MLKKFFAVVVSAILIALPVNADVINNPNNIPLFDNYSTPVMKPGESGFFSFNITNRYSKDMANVSLTLEIYKYATIKEEKNTSEISNAPKFLDDSANINIFTAKDKFASSFFSIIPKNATKPIRVKISSETSTPQGTYFIRTMINFDYENQHYVMKSIGHFTKEQWNKITENIDEKDKYANINITYLNSLGVSALIPESSFSVKEPFPLWILYVLIGIASFFLVMAIVFYIKDERKRK